MHNKNSFKLFKHILPVFISLMLMAFHQTPARSQNGPSTQDTLSPVLMHPETDTLHQESDTLHHHHDTLHHDREIHDTLLHHFYMQRPDTLIYDETLPGVLQDTPALSPRPGRQNNFINSKVEYTARDSIDFSVTEQKFFLWGEGYVKYENIELKADYIEIDLVKSEVFASGLTDSLGQVTGKPVMTERNESFQAETMRYNFQTKRGIISGIMTEQEGGFLHGNTTKKHENDHLHIQGGKYTSCDLDHPHFYIALTRAKVIPDDKVISGPAYLVIEDIPLPLAVPFGFFPNKPDRTSGILFPTYGEEASRGFFLRQGGYYLHINDYMDLRLEGDIYSLGSWAANAASTYNKRYRYRGGFRYAYSSNVAGDRGMANYQKNTSYNITWNHAQDAKASPNSNFSASVNFGSSSFNRYNTVNPDVFATNTAQSSISFSHRWPDSPFNFSSNINANQNFSNNTVNIRLPSMNLNMTRQYPFRRAQRTGDYSWYENIELSYSSRLDNRISTYDTLLFRRETLGNMESGFSHDLPLRLNFRLLNLLNITPGINYSGVMYTSSIRKTWVDDYIDPVSGNTSPRLITDTIPGIIYGHAINPNFSTGLSQNIYGMFQFRDSRIEAIRHVMTPSVSFSFTPDMRGIMPDYYREVQRDTLGNTENYSIFQGQMYGTPSARGRAGSISFGLRNNLEMKVRDYSDTVNQSRKVSIFDQLNFTSGYNIYADSMKLQNINITGSTSLFENKVRVNVNAMLDPYALDENNRRYNAYEWSVSRSPGRITRAGLSLTMGLRSAAAPRPMGETMPGAGYMPPAGAGMPMIDPVTGHELDPDDERLLQQDYADHPVYGYYEYVDFSVPWNLSIRYNLNYSKPGVQSQINQTLNFSGDMSLTPNWRIQFTSGYDFEAKKFTMTNINIHRDLHCWDMRFGVVPFGTRKSWSFSIQVKSNILRDLKYRTHRSWYDNFVR